MGLLDTFKQNTDEDMNTMEDVKKWRGKKLILSFAIKVTLGRSLITKSDLSPSKIQVFLSKGTVKVNWDYIPDALRVKQYFHGGKKKPESTVARQELKFDFLIFYQPK